MRTTTTIAAALFLSHSAHAHHSNAAIDMDALVTFDGTLVEYSLRNPHAYLVVETTAAGGDAVQWEIQMGSALSLSRRGWDENTLSIGDRVRVGVRPARDGRPYGLFGTLEKNGVPIAYQQLPRPAVQPSTDSIEGVWIVDRASLGPDYPGGLAELANRDFVMTAAGRAGRESWNQLSMDNPETSCATKPTPGGLIYSDIYPMQIEFLEDEEIVMIRVQYFDQERTVYMDGREHPPANERSHEGHSIGWWEGDTLVVDTANFADFRSPYQNGIPSGAQKHVVERYRLMEDGTHMELEFVLEDPEFLAEPFTHRRELFYSPHIQMTPFNCDLEATRRYLPD